MMMAGLPEKLRVLFTRRAVRALFAVLCGFAGLAAVFFSRPPVVLVTDSAFTALYGERRTMVTKLGLSARLFRRVKTALVSESAGPDLVSLAARAASGRPHAVFFPYRYRDGALRYIRDYPDVRAAVLAGREPRAPDPAGAPEAALAWYSTDVGTDLYRGGFCAGLLTPPAGEILAGALDPEQRAALLRGVEESAGQETASRVRFSGDFSGGDLSKTACVVLAGGGTAFLEKDTNIPFILYSWLDPAALPGGAAVLFSDSPWEILPEALKLLEKGRFEGAVPSVPRVLGGKTAGLSPGRIKKLNFSLPAADN
jgi:hypothetical protein